MKRSIWKKVVCVLLCAAALFALASCKQKIVADWVAQDRSPAEQPPKELLERIVTDYAANKNGKPGRNGKQTGLCKSITACTAVRFR